MKTNNYLYILLFLLLLTSCTAAPEETSPGLVAPVGEVVEIIVGDYPVWAAGDSPETGTRTSIDPDDETKTKWEKGDKLWIRMVYKDGNFVMGTIYGTATYNGQTWDHDFRWPVGVTGAHFYAFYIGKHEPDNDEYFWDTDILRSGDNANAGEPVTLGTFSHQTNRIIITHQSTEPLYLSGSGFGKMRVATDYALGSVPLADGEYLLIEPVDIFYLRFWSGPRQVYKKVNDEYKLVGDLNFSHEDIYAGYTYTIDLGGGATNPNEEQKKAREKQRFLAWADAYRNNTKRESFTLEADIDLTGVEWASLDFEDRYTFDGGGHTISGLEVTKGGVNGYTGLFGYVMRSTIKNLHVFGTVKGASSTGGIAGSVSSATIENVSFTGSVTGGMYTGGIVGYAIQSRFTNCRYLGPDDLKFLRGNSVNNTINPGCSPWDYEP